MHVAALYDIHGNLPALEATLSEIAALYPDLIVVGGDVAGGPLPRATLDRLMALGDRARFIMGNGDREMMSFFNARATTEQSENSFAAVSAWAAAQITPSQRDFLASFAESVVIERDHPLWGAFNTMGARRSVRLDVVPQPMRLEFVWWAWRCMVSPG